jgi:UDP-N-acetylglucosamine 1-carboxyvinyltransferase
VDALLIQGPATLHGKIRVSGSKNSALPMLFGALLSHKPLRYTNVPRLWDIETTLELLTSVGTESKWDKVQGVIDIYPQVHTPVAAYEFVKKMRAGILALGPLVARSGEARVSLPGGCAIGARPVNFHLEALRSMGVHVEMEQGYIVARAPKGLQGADILFPQVTVTGTENILMAAVQANGTTVLRNAASEPEVVAVGKMLQAWGAKIDGLGTDTITVQGTQLHPTEAPVEIPADRIEAGTWIAASAITRCPLQLENVPFEDMTAVIKVFETMGMQLEWSAADRVLATKPARSLSPIEIETQPHPAFPTDMQAQLMAVLCTVPGRSRIKETIFENRFMHVAELRRLGANIETHGNEAVIHGGIPLKAAPVMATDLRASASLVLAALAAEGESRITRIYHLDRGYQRLDEKLVSLGAVVRRVKE